MSKTIKIILVIVLVVVVVFLIFDSTKTQNNPIDNNEPIKIGVLAPTSGFVSDYGEEILRGISSVDSKGFRLIVEDTECDARKGLDAYRKLVEVDNVHFLIGPGCGAPQEIIAPRVAEDNVVVIVPSAATRSLHEVSKEKMFFTQYALEDESQFIADKMYELGYEDVILVSFQNAFSAIHVNNFKQHFKGNIVAELSFLNETTDVASELVKIKDIDADAIFSTDITFLFAQGAARLKQYGIDLPVFSQYATELPAVRDLVVDGMIYSFPDGVGEEGAVFELSKLSAEKMFSVVRECDGDTECVKDALTDSGEYNEFGVRDQSIILKQILNGEAVPFKL